MPSQTDVQSRARQIVEIEIERLVRSDLGALSFETERPMFEAIRRTAASVAAADMSVLPTQLQHYVSQSLQRIWEALNRIQALDPKHAAYSAQQRVQAIAHLNEAFNDGAAHLSTAIVLSGADLLTVARESSAKAVDEIRLKGEEAERLASAQYDQLQRMVEAAKEAAQSIGVSRHAAVFAEEASSNRRAATLWLWISVGVLFATLAFGAVLLYRAAFTMPANLTASQSVQLVLAKVLMLSVLVSMSVAAIRIYRAQLHNETVNKHRHNALRTFEVFASAAVDDQTKSAVLTQATQCIFSPQHTGFISDDKDAGGYPQILEIVRAIPRKEGG